MDATDSPPIPDPAQRELILLTAVQPSDPGGGQGWFDLETSELAWHTYPGKGGEVTGPLCASLDGGAHSGQQVERYANVNQAVANYPQSRLESSQFQQVLVLFPDAASRCELGQQVHPHMKTQHGLKEDGLQGHRVQLDNFFSCIDQNGSGVMEAATGEPDPLEREGCGVEQELWEKHAQHLCTKRDSLHSAHSSALRHHSHHPQMPLSVQGRIVSDHYVTLGQSLWEAGVNWEGIFLAHQCTAGEGTPAATNATPQVVVAAHAASQRMWEGRGAPGAGAKKHSDLQSFKQAPSTGAEEQEVQGCSKALGVKPSSDSTLGILKKQKFGGEFSRLSEELNTKQGSTSAGSGPGQQATLSRRLAQALKSLQETPPRPHSCSEPTALALGSYRSPWTTHSMHPGTLAPCQVLPGRRLHVSTSGDVSAPQSSSVSLRTSLLPRKRTPGAQEQALELRHKQQRPEDNPLQRRPSMLPEGERDAWVVSGVRTKLIMLAEALDEGRMTSYNILRTSLASHANHKGNTDERVVAMFLEALEFRRQGRGFEACNTIPKLRIGHKKKSTLWFATAHPMPLFLSCASLGMIIPKITGREKVHLFCLGYTLIAQLSVFMRMLTQGTTTADAMALGATQISSERPPQCSTMHQRLQKLRVTFVDPLMYPGREDLREAAEWDKVVPFLISDAESLGVELHFDHLILSENSTDCLDLVERLPGETTAACCALELYAMCDDPGLPWAPLQKFMKTLVRLRAAVVAVVNTSFEGAHSLFLPRYIATLDFMRKQYESHDACTDKKRTGKRWQHVFEEYLLRGDTYGMISCEGSDRRIRHREQESWNRVFEFWGFSLNRQSKALQESLVTIFSSFPTGFSVECQENYTYLMWKRFRQLVACSFSPATLKQPIETRLN